LLDRIQALGMDSLAITITAISTAPGRSTPKRRRENPAILGFEAYVRSEQAHARKARRDAPLGAPYSTSCCSPGTDRLSEPDQAVSIGSWRAITPAAHRQGSAGAAHEGIIGLAACLSGEVALYLRQGNYEAAKASAEWFARTFGPNGFWLEVQNHGIAEEQLVTEGMFRLGAELGLPVAATNDAHYLRKDDAEAHESCSPSAPAKTSTIPSASASSAGELRQVRKEMAALFGNRADVLAETARVAELCEFDFEKRYFLRSIRAPRSSRPTRTCWSISHARARSSAMAIRCRMRSSAGWTTSSTSSRAPGTPAISHRL